MTRLLFGFGGRIGRGPFWAGQAVVLLLVGLYAVYVDRLLAAWIPGSIFLGFAVAMILALPIIWMQAAITIKRCHDRGKTGFWSMLLLLPVVGLIWLVIDCGILPAAGKSLAADVVRRSA
jgi:uncharacterized membrane protein YhaH (DUF805 family)